MAGSFKNKIVVISGGSRGIGRGIAQAFAKEGAQTVLAASNEANLAKASEMIAKTGAPKPDICAGDLKQLSTCEAVHRFVKDRYGRCDILINSAGATRAGAFLDLADDLWMDGFALKFFACMRLSKLFWPMLREAQGHIVNINGGAARTPDPGFMIGGSVNSAMANFTKALAGLGKREGVNVNAILPGLTETERVSQLMEQRAKAEGITPEQARANQVAKEGIRRLGTPEDVSALALFLCSESARHIQGTAIAVDGGATPGLY